MNQVMFWLWVVSLVVAIAAVVVAGLAYDKAVNPGASRRLDANGSFVQVTGPFVQSMTSADSINILGPTSFTGPIGVGNSPVVYVLATKSGSVQSPLADQTVDLMGGGLTLPSAFNTNSILQILVQGRMGSAPSAGTKTLELATATRSLVVFSTVSSTANTPFSVEILMTPYMASTSNVSNRVYVQATARLGGQIVSQVDSTDFDAWSVGAVIKLNMKPSSGTNQDVVYYSAVANVVAPRLTTTGL